MSDAGPKGDRMLNRTSWADNEFEYDYQTHLVPFLVWSNYDTTSNDAGLLGVNQLLPLVSQYYDIPSAAYWDFLNDMRSHYAATDSMIITENNYSYRRVKQMDSEELQYYNAFRLLQYDYISGKKYASRLWETKK